LTTHTMASPWIIDHGPSTLAKFNSFGTPFPIIFSHASFLSPADTALLRKHNHYVSITPESEMHYGHSHPNTPFIQDQSALGVDSAFTSSADIATQARIWLQATRRKFFMRTLEGWKMPSNNPMTVNQAFLLATRNGGLALRRDDLGVIKVGAKADLVVFDGLSPNMLGWSDPVAAIILHSNVGDVMHVMVDGEWRKRDGKLVVSHDRAEVEEMFLQSVKGIQKIWEDAAVPTLKGEFMAGVHYAPTEVQSTVQGSR
ncbi:metal-dependent hydrolase, partial [Fusarium oxysporum]